MSPSNTPRFQFNSTQTALAFIVPEHLQAEINSLRKIHDKAYTKWPPHINIIYPFVGPSLLSAATSILREALQTNEIQPVDLNTHEVGLFRHRRNATIFVKPSDEQDEAVCELRRVLVRALGCDEGEGTRDGIFRPHLSIGQAGLNGNHIERLMEQAGKLEKLSWNARSLVVLRRQESGEMQVVDELRISDADDEEVGSKTHLSKGDSGTKSMS